MTKTLKQTHKPRQKIGLHRFVAEGGKPKDYEACQGVNPGTVPGHSSGKKKNY